MPFSLYSLSHTLWLFYACIYLFVFVVFWLNVYNNNKNPKKHLCGLLDLLWDIGLRIRQHSLCKRTWPMPTFMKPNACELKLHLIHHWRSIKGHLQHDHYGVVTLNLWLMPSFEVICYMGKTWRRSWSCQAWMWISLFDALLFNLLFVY
jgi:hypothetical protein